MKKARLLILPVVLASLGLVVGCDQGTPAQAAASDARAAHSDDDGHGHHEKDAHGHDEADAHGHDEKDGHGHAQEKPAAEGEHGEEVKLTAEGAKKAGIRIETVRKHALVDTIQAPARVTFNAEGMAHVGTPLSGRVSQIKVKIGDKVHEGDALLIVQSPDLGQVQSDYLLQRMAVETAGPAVDLAKAAHERAKALYAESQGIALTEVQKREAEYKASRGAQLAAQAQATAAENRLHLLGMDQQAVQALETSKEITPHYTVRAPIRGQVIEREATLGELVNPDREALLILADMSTLWVLADVPESRLSHVALGAKAQVTVPALPGKPLEGTVTFIAPALDPNTRTVSVRIEIEGNGHGLRPGMFAQAVITESGGDGRHEPVLAIPEEATQWVEGELVVFVPVEGEENTFAKRPVKVGPAVGRLLPVVSGLKEGDPFVAAGSFILKAEHGKSSAEHVH
jgi:cobalt-zinc-cadmium efflux system membrane fusion protein